MDGEKKRMNLILAIVAIAQLMDILDMAIVNVALPSISRQFHLTNPSVLQWVVSAYTLAYGGFLLLGGRSADVFGRKRTFLGGSIVFVLASFATGIAQSDAMINIARAFQGLGAAFMSPAALSIVLTTFTEKRERNRALGLWGAIGAGGAAIGLLIGGVVTQSLGWRWNFFINVPIGLAIILIGARYIPESKAEGTDRKRLDLPGALLATIGLVLLVFGLTGVPVYGWGAVRTIGSLIGGLVVLATFLIVESRVSEPLVPFRIFEAQNVGGANLVNLLVVMGMSAVFFFLTLYLQNSLGLAPLATGLGFLPIAGVIGIAAGVVSRMVSRTGYKLPMTAGPFIAAVGLLVLANVRSGGSYGKMVAPGIVVAAFGIGLSYVSNVIAATNNVPARLSGLASALLNSTQQIGMALGVAILSTVASSRAASYLALNGASAGTVAEAQITGYRGAFLVGAGIMTGAAILALAVIRQRKGEKVVFNPNAGLGVSPDETDLSR